MSERSTRKKLIEVALPLEAINIASAREKSIRHGHPSTLHLWWSRKPLATCRAVLFASLVDDPSSCPEEFPTEAEQDEERQRLFRIIERLVQWENSNSAEVLSEAKAEIMKSTGGNPPPVLDPFCGGGSIPLEAQRLGLEAHGSDLNPVAVLITKALIEIPPKFAGLPPINPEARSGLAYLGEWKGAIGLAQDVRYYGKWMRDEAEKRIGHLYLNAHLPSEMGGGEATVIAWLWARTVKCPNPACGVQMPLISKFWLSSKAGREVWVDPHVTGHGEGRSVEFRILSGTPSNEMRKRLDAGSYVFTETDKHGKPLKKIKKAKATFRCIACEVGVVTGDLIDREATASRMGVMPVALVAESAQGRIYLPFNIESAKAIETEAAKYLSQSGLLKILPSEGAKGTFASNAQGRIYGFNTFADYFTSRQRVALGTYTALIKEVRQKVLIDAQDVFGATHKAIECADAIATYLALGVSRLSDICNSLCRWENTKTQVRNLFTQQGIPMMWDYAEPNVFAGAAGDYTVSLSNLLKVLERSPAEAKGYVLKRDAAFDQSTVQHPLICTDPPYYTNVSYADISDFFYVWLRRSLSDVYPDIFGTLLSPKASELIASPARFDGDSKRADEFFEDGLSKSFSHMRNLTNHEYPATVFYALRQTETDEDNTFEDGQQLVASTGWEKMLEGLLRGGFQVVGTWPIRSEMTTRMVATDANSLASSIVLVCRPRPEDAPIATRREFVNALRRELEDALLKMMHGNVAPVDLAQATIGPGMAVYSRYSKVIETDGKPLRIRTALQIINQELATILAADEGEYDGNTRFCLAWFEQYGMQAAAFGEADVLARAKDTSVQGLSESGVLEAKAGKVRLLKREELPTDWNPQKDDHVPVWECTQQLVRALLEQGEGAAARICAILEAKAEPARDLAYRLYSICERKGWTQEALAYNSLVIAWPEIARLASNPNIAQPQTGLFAGMES